MLTAGFSRRELPTIDRKERSLIRIQRKAAALQNKAAPLADVIDDALNIVDGRPIPDLDRLHKLGLPRWPVGDAMCFASDPASPLPLASVCLNDSFEMLCEGRYALLEGFRQLEHYRLKEPPNELSAVFFGQFYGADVALRLYAAGEHLANAILKMLPIDSSAIAPYRRDRVSLQGAIAQFLRAKVPEHPVSGAVLRLGGSEDWKWTVNYRNLWVHDQAPLVSGLGLVFKRGKQIWRRDGSDGWSLSFGGGDKPELSVEDLLERTRVAACLLTDALVVVTEYYNALLAAAARLGQGTED